MNTYKVLSETGVSLKGDEVIHAQGEVIELDSAADQTKALVESGSIQEIQPVGKEAGPFRVTVTWTPGSSDLEVEQAQSFVARLVNDVNGDADQVPMAIESIVIKRI